MSVSQMATQFGVPWELSCTRMRPFWSTERTQNPRGFNFDYRWLCGFAYLFLLRSSVALKFQFQPEFGRENSWNVLCWGRNGTHRYYLSNYASSAIGTKVRHRHDVYHHVIIRKLLDLQHSICIQTPNLYRTFLPPGYQHKLWRIFLCRADGLTYT
jgi:hypothetical protein